MWSHSSYVSVRRNLGLRYICHRKAPHLNFFLLFAFDLRRNMLHFTPIFLFFSLCSIVAADVNITAWNTQIIWPPATNSTPAWTPTESRCSPTGDGHFAFQRNMSVSYEFTGKFLCHSPLTRGSNLSGRCRHLYCASAF